MHGAVEVGDRPEQRGQRAEAIKQRTRRLNELEGVERLVVVGPGKSAHHSLDTVRPVRGAG